MLFNVKFIIAFETKWRETAETNNFMNIKFLRMQKILALSL